MKELYRMPLGDRMRHYIEKQNREESLDCFFGDDVRKTLEFVYASMKRIGVITG